MARFQDKNGIVATNGLFQETLVNGSRANASVAPSAMYMPVTIPAAATSITVQLPPGCIVTNILVNVSTLFNGTTPTVVAGTGVGASDLMGAKSIASTGTNNYLSSTFAAVASGIVYLTVVGGSSAGAAKVLVGFIPASPAFSSNPV